MRRIRTTAAAGLMPLALLVLPVGASAATTVGSNLLGTANAWPSPNVSSAPRAQPPGVTLPLTTPSAGVIVQIQVKHGGSGADPGSYGFRVLNGGPSGASANYTTNGAPAELPDFPWPANDTAGTRLFIPSLGVVAKGIPIAAGERLGVVRIGGTGQGAILKSNSSGATLNQVLAVHNSGQLIYDTTVPNELLVQYRIEPDADRDGFGDETQDRCPTNAGIQTACPAAASPAKKCKRKRKKKGSRAAGAAKKKKRCKRKRKKKR